ncbi:MAG: aminotransferase class III-fold pyridoxal phosphate-dependent enzyme [Peptococcaceae bacterium]|nr:aminotransferase class III-fold pyridoxal phosphate-dependent enzyme [Peptococcaceae bacterium]
MPGVAGADGLVRLDRDHVWHHIVQHKVFETQEPLIFVEGKGCVLKDIRGREFLDATSGGVWCVSLGYGRESIAEAVYKQLKEMPYYAMTAGNIPAVMLAEKLVSLLPNLKRVFYSNSGSEANETAFKMTRQYFRIKYKDRDKHKIIYRQRDYHGTTMAALSATGQPERKMGYEPMVPGFLSIPAAYCYRCEFGKTYPGCDLECARALEKLILAEDPDTVGAVILEPITAGGGVIIPPDGYYGIIQETCRKYEVLLIMDEVVNGFGRTGKMFGHQHWNVDPDMVTVAKGIASAYMPLSATMVKEEIFNVFLNDPSDKLKYFRHISTYGGNAAACAAGLESVRIVEEEDLCRRSAEMGRYLLESLKDQLSGHPMAGDIRGRGLFAGIELVEDKASKAPVDEKVIGRIIADISAQGVLVGRTNRSIPNGNNIINLAPAFVVTREQIDRIVVSIRNALEKIK